MVPIACSPSAGHQADLRILFRLEENLLIILGCMPTVQPLFRASFSQGKVGYKSDAEMRNLQARTRTQGTTKSTVPSGTVSSDARWMGRTESETELHDIDASFDLTDRSDVMGAGQV